MIAMKEEHRCRNCAHNWTGIVKVDFGYGGIWDEECFVMDDMSDEEVELANIGECPRWQPIDEAEMEAEAEAEYQYWLDMQKEEQ